MKLSIVATLFNSAPYVPDFVRRCVATARQVSEDFEIVLVNDGSPDESLQVALAAQASEPRLRIVDLSRNFGHHKAMMTGLAHSRGNLVFLIDSDLEEPPELLLEFYAKIRERSDADVVFGVQKQRKGHAFERWTGHLHYAIINALWRDQKLPENLVVARLMTRRYVDSLLEFRESELVISGLWQAAGYTQIALPVTKGHKRSSSYHWRRKVALMIRTVTVFSDRPLSYIAYLGVVVLALAVVLIAAAIGSYVLSGKPPEGYFSLIISIWLLGGLTIFSIGIVATYLSVIYVETKHRPYTIVREVYEPRSITSNRSPSSNLERTS